MKYKVGDRVRVRKDLETGARYFMLDGNTHNVFVGSMIGHLGKVVTIASERGRQYSIKEDDGVWGWVDEMFEGLAPSKIVVTTDGQTTTARLFSGKELVKSAEAKCSPQDAFVFETGAAIALDRLLDREEKAEAPSFKKELLVNGRFGCMTGGKWFVIVGNSFVYESGGFDFLSSLREDGSLGVYGVDCLVDACSFDNARSTTARKSEGVVWIRPGVKF